MKPEYLSDREFAGVQRVLTDASALEGIRKVLLSGVYSDGILQAENAADPLKNFILAAFTTQTASLLSFEEKGRKLETIINAVSLVESGFKQLEKCKPVETGETNETINKAR